MKKKEITDRRLIDSFIEGCSTVRLGFVSRGEPYIVPVNFVYLDGSVFFHCACEGRKYESLKAGGRICLEFDITHGTDHRGASTFYTSVIAWGAPRILVAREEKIQILGLLCEKYLGEKRKITDTMADGTCVTGVALDTVTGKESRS